MKNIWNWVKKNPNRTMFLIPIILVAGISISHVVSWYDIANPISWAIYLSIAIEIAAMTALVAAINKIKGGVWFMFGLVTFVQMIGNIFFSFKEIEPSSQLFQSWIELTKPIWEAIGSDTNDITAMKRWLAFLEGGLLPIISLTSLHFFIKYDDGTKNNSNLILTDIDAKSVNQTNTEVKNQNLQKDVLEEKIISDSKDLCEEDSQIENKNNTEVENETNIKEQISVQSVNQNESNNSENSSVESKENSKYESTNNSHITQLDSNIDSESVVAQSEKNDVIDFTNFSNDDLQNSEKSNIENRIVDNEKILQPSEEKLFETELENKIETKTNEVSEIETNLVDESISFGSDVHGSENLFELKKTSEEPQTFENFEINPTETIIDIPIDGDLENSSVLGKKLSYVRNG